MINLFRLSPAVAALTAAFLLSGCTTSYDASVSVSSNGTVTGTATIHIKPVQQARGVPLVNFQSALSSGYSVILNVPTSNFSLNQSGTPQATLTASTDQGFTSSTVVTLQPVASTTSPVAAGYSVYTFKVPNTAQLQSWTQQVSQHATSNLALTSNVDTVFDDLGNGNTYTIYAHINSIQTNVVSAGSVSYTSQPPAPTNCVHSPCPVLN